MEPFVTIQSTVVPLDRINVDTDAIVPKQFLKKIDRTGFGIHLFHDWRFLDQNGEKPDPDFILNKKELRDSKILLTRENFGCGSSREHAPWALMDWGFRVIISPSFADIFYNNAMKNSILPIILSSEEVESLFQRINKDLSTRLTIDLTRQSIHINGGGVISFQIDSFKKNFLINGIDDITRTLQMEKEISEYEKKSKESEAWLWVSNKKDG